MSKGKWGKALALGGLLALGIWLLWQMGLALLTVKSVLPENALIPGQWAGAFLAAFVGSRFAARRSGLGTLVAALAAAAVFAGMAALLGFLMFGELGFSGQGLGALAGLGLGGLAAGLLPLGGKRRKKATGRKGRR